jgi:hypothetical protein
MTCLVARKIDWPKAPAKAFLQARKMVDGAISATTK